VQRDVAADEDGVVGVVAAPDRCRHLLVVCCWLELRLVAGRLVAVRLVGVREQMTPLPTNQTNPPLAPHLRTSTNQANPTPTPSPAHRHPSPRARPHHEPVTLPDPPVAQSEPAQAVGGADVDAGVVEDQVGAVALEEARERAAEDLGGWEVGGGG